MLDVLYVEQIEQADALLKPKRVEVLRHLAEPSTCTQIGEQLGESPQSIYYHVKRLQSAGLVTLVDERRVRGIAEGIYQSVARSFWVSPALVGRLGPPRAPQDLLGLGYLLNLTEMLQSELAALAAGPPALPSFGISGEIQLAPDQGAAFVGDLQRAFAEILDRYSGGEGHTFGLALACFPRDATGKAAPPTAAAAEEPAEVAGGPLAAAAGEARVAADEAPLVGGAGEARVAADEAPLAGAAGEARVAADEASLARAAGEARVAADEAPLAGAAGEARVAADEAPLASAAIEPPPAVPEQSVVPADEPPAPRAEAPASPPAELGEEAYAREAGGTGAPPLVRDESYTETPELGVTEGFEPPQSPPPELGEAEYARQAGGLGEPEPADEFMAFDEFDPTGYEQVSATDPAVAPIPPLPEDEPDES